MDLANYWRDVQPFTLASVPVATGASTPPPPPRPNRDELVLERRLPPTPLAPPKDYRYIYPRPLTLDIPTPPPPARPTQPYRAIGSSLAAPSNTSPPRQENNKETIEDLSDSMSRTSLGRRRTPSNGMHRIFGEPPRRHIHGPPSITEDEALSVNSFQREADRTGNLPPRPQPAVIDPADDPTGAKAYDAVYRYELAMQQWRQARREVRNRAAAIPPNKAERVYRDHQRALRDKEKDEERERRDRAKRLEREYKEERRTDVMRFAMRKQIQDIQMELAKERAARERIKEAKEKVDAKMEEDLTCAVCSGLIVDAHQTNPCGHVACGTCLVNWLQTQVQEGKTASCFLCRTDVDLCVPILPVRAIDDLAKIWVDGKSEAGPWPLYEDYVERQRRWSAWKQVHPKLFDPELFPETVAPRRQETRQYEAPPQYVYDEADPVDIGLIEGLFNMVEDNIPGAFRSVRDRAPTPPRAADVFLRQTHRRPRQGMMFADDFFPRIPYTPRPDHNLLTPGILSARLRGNVQEQIREFERRNEEAERELRRHLGFRR